MRVVVFNRTVYFYKIAIGVCRKIKIAFYGDQCSKLRRTKCISRVVPRKQIALGESKLAVSIFLMVSLHSPHILHLLSFSCNRTLFPFYSFLHLNLIIVFFPFIFSLFRYFALPFVIIAAYVSFIIY